MPVPDYIEIPDSDIDPESPINYSLLARLRDNILAVIGGGLGAPAMRPSLLGLYGSSAEGVLLDSWAPTAAGYYDFESDEPSILSTAHAIPWFSFIRVSGDLTISNTLTIDQVPSDHAAEIFGLTPGAPGAAGDSTIVLGQGGCGGGGGHHAAGGAGGSSAIDGAGGAARSLSSDFRWWLSKTLPCGGQGGDGGVAGAGNTLGGGVIVLMVEGNLVLTGGTIQAPGAAGVFLTSGGNVAATGGGAGGTIIVICTGTITGGTFLAPGGAGGNNSAGGGGGGGSGGAIVLVASAYAGVQVKTAAGGSGPGAGADGGAGYTEQTTLTAEVIRGLFWR